MPTPMFERDWKEDMGTTWLDYEGNPTGFETDTSVTGYLADAFGEHGGEMMRPNNVVGAEQFGANPWHGQMVGGLVPGQFGNNLAPVNNPILGTAGYYSYPAGGAAFTPAGQSVMANNMTNYWNQAVAWEMEQRRLSQARKDQLNLELEKARIAAESRRYAMDKWGEAWGEGGGDFDFDYPEGFFAERGKQYATTKGDYKKDIPRMMPDVQAIARGDVDQAVMPDMGGGDQLNEIFAQGRGAGLDVARGKLGEEIGKKQAELIAGQQGAEAQQGVANSRWIQDLRDAIAKVEGKVQQQGLDQQLAMSQTMPGGYGGLLTQTG